MNILRRMIAVCMCCALFVPTSAVASQGRSLPNTIFKLNSQKPVTVGYFGGSLTLGSGATNAQETSWRGRVEQWFNAKYPQVQFNHINASIGGFGSIPGAFRLEGQLLVENPDLVFVESAVNDWNANEAEVKRSLEGIVRQIYTYNPKTEIVFVYTTSKDIAEQSYSIGQEMKTVTWHETIAAHYGIPTINAGRALFDAVDSEQISWDELYPTNDKTHPNDAGHEIFANSVIEFLQAELSKQGVEKDCVMPAKLNENCYDKATIIDAWDQTVVTSQGFTRSGAPMGGRHPDMMESQTKDATMEVSFFGTTVGLYWLKANNGGMLEYSIDDGTANTISACDAAAVSGAPRGTFNILTTSLENKNHKLRVRVTGEPGTDSTGNWIKIGGFFVSGRASVGDVQPQDEEQTTEIFSPKYKVLFDKVGIPQVSQTNSRITRGQAAIVIAAMLGIPDNSVIEQRYNDVTSTHEAYGAINLINVLGIASDDDMFYPDRAISRLEISKLLVAALGQDNFAQGQSVNMEMYLYKAMTLNLFNKVQFNADSTITASNFEELVYNALTADMSVKNIHNGGIRYTSGHTILSHYHNIMHATGVVNATHVTSLAGYEKVGDGTIVIGDVKLKTSTNIHSLLGYRVKYFYEGNNGEFNLVSVDTVENKVLRIDSEDISGFANNVYTYSNSAGNSTKIEAPLDIDLIRNGVKTDRTPLLMQTDNGYVEFLDNNIDGRYDVLFVYSFREIVVGRVAEDILHDLVDAGGKLDFNVMKYNFCLTNGQQVDLSHLERYNVLSAAINGDYVYGIVSKNYVKGVVEEIGSGVKINGLTFEIAPEFTRLNEIKPGNTCNLYLNRNNQIVWCTQNSQPVDNYAYLIAAAQSNSINKNVEIKVLTVDGKTTVLGLKNTVNINGTAKETPQILAEVGAYNGVIRYTMGEDGQISRIDIAQNPSFSAGGALYSDNTAGTALLYRSSLLSFGGKITVSPDSTVFVIPSSGLDEDYYTGSIDMLTDRRTYTVAGYRTDRDSLKSGFVALYDGTSSTYASSSPIMLVTRKTMVQNEKGENVIAVYGMVSSNEVRYQAASKGLMDSVQPGDIIRILTNGKGALSAFSVIYSAETESFTGIGSSFTSDPWVQKGRIFKNDETHFQLYAGSDIDSAGSDQLITFMFNANRPIIMYNTVTHTAELGAHDELLDYHSYGANASQVIVSTSAGVLNWMIVMK